MERITGYDLHAQVGFLLRQATQRHLGIFGAHLPELTPTQFAALAQLHALGPISQNALGRATAMDAATIKGVVDRLRARGLVTTRPDPGDQRRIYAELTGAGRALITRCTKAALQITAETLEPLTEDEREAFLALLRKLV
ncbi:MAG: MarR family transcriptional regulator [Pseudomonadota bacterium]